MRHPLQVVSIDDDPQDGVLLGRALEASRHWAVAHAHYTDPTAGLICVLERAPDILFLDVLLGPRTGLDVLERLVEEGYSGPVVMLTGYDSPDLAVGCMKAGAFDWIAKHDLRPDTVDQTMAAAVEWSRVRRAGLDRQRDLLAENERLQEKSRRLERVSRVISQELQTPLAVAAEFSRLLRVAGEDDFRDTYATLVSEACRQAEGHVADMWDLVRIAEGDLRLETRSEAAGAFLRRAVSLMLPLATNRRVQLRLFASRGLGEVNLDVRRMLQVLMDVIRHQIVACVDGGLVDVRGRRDGETLRVSVETNAAEPEARALVRMAQGEDLGDGFEMLSLSLQHAREVVVRHGGELTAALRDEGGIEWSLVLPAREASGEGTPAIEWAWQTDVASEHLAGRTS